MSEETEKQVETSPSPNLHLTDLQKSILDSIANKDLGRLKQNLVDLKTSVDFYDDCGMTPLQHAAYKGDKDAVQILLDRNSNVNSCKHKYGYTALHFGALSGSVDTCMLLLLAGANANATNSVSRTPAQMAAFVNQKPVVQAINNFIPRAEIEKYTQPNGDFPQILTDHLHRFVMSVNLHPVRLALSLQKVPTFLEQVNLVKLKQILSKMSEKEMKRQSEPNEVMALKYHYLSWIVGELQRAKDASLPKEGENKKPSDFVELFTKKVLKPAKENQMDYLEITIRDCVREFPWRECTIFRQIVNQLVNKQNALPAFDILRQSILGSNVFADNIAFCDACGEENPSKKCSKCKIVSYCDRECQRIHWFAHKKVCAREVSSNNIAINTEQKEPIDISELQGALAQMNK